MAKTPAADSADHAPLHPCFVIAHMNLTGSNAVQAVKAIRTIYRRDYGREAPPPRPLTPAELPMVEALMLTLTKRQRSGLQRVFTQLAQPEPCHCPVCGSHMEATFASPAPGFVSWCNTCDPRCDYDPRHVVPADPEARAAHYETCPLALAAWLQFIEVCADADEAARS